MCFGLTDSAASHVWSKLHAVGTGAGILGGVVCDLRGLQAEVLTATIWQCAHITGIRSFGNTGKKKILKKEANKRLEE